MYGPVQAAANDAPGWRCTWWRCGRKRP